MKHGEKIAALSMIGVSMIALFSLILFVVIRNQMITVNSPAPKIDTSASKVNPPTVSALLAASNDERAKVGVAPLKIDERLNASAQQKANDMFEFKYFSHDNPATGKHGYDYATALIGQECTYVSENIRKNNVDLNSTRVTMDAWMNSKAHREAIQSAKYDLVGFGIKDNYIVQHFCELR